MASHEIADMIFNLKDKLSDKEFKDIMDKLSIKKKEEYDTYLITYIKQEHKLTSDDDGIYYKIEHKYKQKKVRLFDDNDEDFKKTIDEFIDNKFLNMIDLFNELKIPSMKIIKLDNQYWLKPDDNERRVWLHNPYYKNENENNEDNENENNEDDDNKKGMFLKFNDCLFMNIKKIS